MDLFQLETFLAVAEERSLPSCSATRPRGTHWNISMRFVRQFRLPYSGFEAQSEETKLARANRSAESRGERKRAQCSCSRRVICRSP